MRSDIHRFCLVFEVLSLGDISGIHIKLNQFLPTEEISAAIVLVLLLMIRNEEVLRWGCLNRNALHIKFHENRSLGSSFVGLNITRTRTYR